MVLVASSVLQLSSERIRELNIRVVEYPLFVNGEPYPASIHMSWADKQALREIIKEQRNRVTTAGLGHAELVQAYHSAPPGRVVHMEQSLTVTSASAEMMNQVAREYPRLDLVQFDTRAIAAAYSIQVLEAARAVHRGIADDALLEFISTNRRNTGHLGVIYDLSFLHRSGKIGFAKALLGTAFNVIPLLGSSGEPGRLTSVGRAKTAVQANSLFLRRIAEEMKARQGKRISALIAYCGDHEKEALHMKELLQDMRWETGLAGRPVSGAATVEVHYTNHSAIPHQGPDFYDIGYVIYAD